MYNHIYSKNTIDLMSKNNKGNNNPFYGKKHSEKFKKRMIGKNNPNSKLTIINNIKYYTIKGACEKLNLSKYKIKRLITDDIK